MWVPFPYRYGDLSTGELLAVLLLPAFVGINLVLTALGMGILQVAQASPLSPLSFGLAAALGLTVASLAAGWWLGRGDRQQS